MATDLEHDRDTVTPSDLTGHLSLRRRGPIVRGLAILTGLAAGLALGLGVYVATLSAEELDADYAAFYMAALFGGAIVLLTVWFVALSDFPRAARQGVAVIALLGIGGLIAAVRFEGFTGDMKPRFAWRWSPKADALLDKPNDGVSGADLSETTDHDYPQFLGPDRRAIIDDVELETDWKQNPPRELWRRPIGAGWSGFAVVGSFAVTQEQRGEGRWLVCYVVETGKPVWSHARPGRFSSVMGGDGPRATPTIDGGNVYAQWSGGELTCHDGATGELLWSRDILADNTADQISWGRSGSPLVTENHVIVSAGGPKGRSLVAYDKQSGQPMWSGGDDRASYASPTLGTLDGVTQALIVNENTVAGHRLDDGKLLWDYPWEGNSDGPANTSQPVVLPDDQVMLSKGYGQGAELIHVRRNDDGEFEARQVWKNRLVMKTKMTNVVTLGDYAYGLSAGILECIDWTTGRRMWRRGRYGHGQVVRVGGTLLITAEQGAVVLVDATPKGHRELARLDALDGKTWNTPALAGNLLLIRNHQEAACYELPMR